MTITRPRETVQQAAEAYKHRIAAAADCQVPMSSSWISQSKKWVSKKMSKLARLLADSRGPDVADHLAATATADEASVSSVQNNLYQQPSSVDNSIHGYKQQNEEQQHQEWTDAHHHHHQQHNTTSGDYAGFGTMHGAASAPHHAATITENDPPSNRSSPGTQIPNLHVILRTSQTQASHKSQGQSNTWPSLGRQSSSFGTQQRRISGCSKMAPHMIPSHDGPASSPLRGYMLGPRLAASRSVRMLLRMGSHSPRHSRNTEDPARTSSSHFGHSNTRLSPAVGDVLYSSGSIPPAATWSEMGSIAMQQQRESLSCYSNSQATPRRSSQLSRCHVAPDSSFASNLLPASPHRWSHGSPSFHMVHDSAASPNPFCPSSPRRWSRASGCQVAPDPSCFNISQPLPTSPHQCWSRSSSKGHGSGCTLQQPPFVPSSLLGMRQLELYQAMQSGSKDSDSLAACHSTGGLKGEDSSRSIGSDSKLCVPLEGVPALHKVRTGCSSQGSRAPSSRGMKVQSGYGSRLNSSFPEENLPDDLEDMLRSGSDHGMHDDGASGGSQGGRMPPVKNATLASADFVTQYSVASARRWGRPSQAQPARLSGGADSLALTTVQW